MDKLVCLVENTSCVVLVGGRGRCRGIGYITFAVFEDAEQACKLEKTLAGRKLQLKFANQKPKHMKRKLQKEQEQEGEKD